MGHGPVSAAGAKAPRIRRTADSTTAAKMLPAAGRNLWKSVGRPSTPNDHRTHSEPLSTGRIGVRVPVGALISVTQLQHKGSTCIEGLPCHKAGYLPQRWADLPSAQASVAETADASGLGPGGVTPVGVRVSPLAPPLTCGDAGGSRAVHSLAPRLQPGLQPNPVAAPRCMCAAFSQRRPSCGLGATASVVSRNLWTVGTTLS